MDSLIPRFNSGLEMVYGFNMVAERVVDEGTLGEINMMADPAMPFDPAESERRVKELIGDTVNKAFEVLRTEAKTDVLTLNAKFDSVKAAQDINDGLLKNVVNEQSSFVNVEFAGVKATFTQAEANLQTMSDAINVLTAEVNLLKATAGHPPGLSAKRDDAHPKSIMEQKVVQNIDKLTNSPADYYIWSLRFKNAMSQVNPKYKELLESTEKLRVQIPTYEYWDVQINKGLSAAIGSEEETAKLKKDLYTVLVEKCTNGQVMQFANDEED